MPRRRIGASGSLQEEGIENNVETYLLLSLLLCESHANKNEQRLRYYVYYKEREKEKGRIEARNEIVLSSIECRKEIRVFSLSIRIGILNDQDSTKSRCR